MSTTETAVAAVPEQPGGKKPYTAPTFRIHAWGITAIAQYFMWKEFDLFRMVLMLSFGIDPVTVGTIYAVPRILDAFMDPIMGHLSDISSTLFGRRKPFMFISSLGSAGLLLILYLAEPNWPRWLQFAYLTAVLTFYYYSWSVFEMNRVAMSYELSDDYSVRSRIQAIGSWWMTAPQLIGSFSYFFIVCLSTGKEWTPAIKEFSWDVGLWVGVILGFLLTLVLAGVGWGGDLGLRGRRILYLLAVLAGLGVAAAAGYGIWDAHFRPETVTPLRDYVFPAVEFGTLKFPNLGSEVAGVRFLAKICAVIIIVFGFIPTLFIKERERVELKKGKHAGLWACLVEALKNRPFRLIIYLRLSETMSTALYAGFTSIISIYYVCGGNKLLSEGWQRIAPAFVGFIIASFVWPLAAPVTRKIGKRWGLILGYGVALLYACILPVLTRPGWVLVLFFYGTAFQIPGAMRGMFLSSTMPDICDVDELKSGERREGLYSSVLTFISQLEVSLCTFLSGILLALAGFDSKAVAKNILPSEAVMRNILWFAFTPYIIFATVAFLITWFMPLTPQVMAKVHAELEARRAAALAAKQTEGQPEAGA